MCLIHRKEKMKQYIKVLKQNLTTVEIGFDLPSSITNLLMNYSLKGDIELEKFVSDSIKKYLSSDINPSTPLSHNSVTLIIRLPLSLVIRLWYKSLKNKIRVSQIVSEALSYSIPVFLDEIQAMEDYMLELGQEDI